MASAGGAPASGGGRRKSLDPEINLVPFIDLLSTCICFLLMTAVWMEIGALQVKQATGTEAAATTSKSVEMDVRFTSPTKIEVALKGGAKHAPKIVVADADQTARLTHLNAELANLATTLKLDAKADLKAQMGQLISVARVTTTTGVPYGDLVAVMDLLRDHGIVNLGVVPVRN